MASTLVRTIKENTIASLVQRRQFVLSQIVMMEDAGLRKTQAHEQAVERARKLQDDIDKLVEENFTDRRELQKGLLMALVSSQLLATVGYKWHDLIKALFGEVDEQSKSLLNKLSYICLKLDEFVGLIDRVGDERLSYNFAGMSDTIEDDLLEAIAKVIYPILERGVQKYMDAGNGHNLQYKTRHA